MDTEGSNPSPEEVGVNPNAKGLEEPGVAQEVTGQIDEERKKKTIGRPGIEVVAERIRRMKEEDGYLWHSKIEQLDRAETAIEPTEPDSYLFNLLRDAGLPEGEARVSALASRVHAWEVKKANALLAKGYIEALGEEGIDSFPEIQPAMDVWVSQFETICSCLGIDPQSPSVLDEGKTILESYRLRLCPIPQDLTGLMFDEGTQGTIKLDVRYGGRAEFGVYFPARALLDEGGRGYGVTHDSDHTKIHEDSHFLTLQFKGEEGYFRDYQLATVGEGFAPIFELWFEGSKKAGQIVPSTEALTTLDRGESPSPLRSGNIDATTQEFWQSAKTEMLIREHSGTTKIAAEIMLLLKSNPHISMGACFTAFLHAESFDNFLTAIGELKPSDGSLDRFNSSVTQLSRLNRHNT